MEEILNYLKACRVFYLATTEGNQPHVRPFGAVADFEGKLYIVTNNQKKVYAQIIKNPKIEISGMYESTWIRIEAEAILDSRHEARVKMMEDNREVLSKMYTVDDNLMEVLYLRNITATIYSFTAKPKVIQF